MSDQYPKRYDLEDTPVRQESELDLPEIYQGGGKWQQYIDLFRLHTYGQLITENQFNKLIEEFDADDAEDQQRSS
jgi:hypothetical protein